MVYQYLGNPYAEQKTVKDYADEERKISLSERIGASSVGMNDERLKQSKVERAAQLLSTATPENWDGVRQQAISEGLGSEETIPLQYDENWNTKVMSAFQGSGGNIPASIQNYNLYRKLTPEEQQLFDRSNRGATSNFINTGGSFVNPYSGASIPKTPPPQDMPDFKGAQEGAKTAATEAAKFNSPEAATNREKALNVKREALVVVNRLINNKEGVMANRGGISSKIPNIRDSSVNAAADLETLTSMLTTENLGLLKGVLSDTDMKVLSDIAAGGLKGADDQVLKNLATLQEKLQDQVEGKTLNTTVGAPPEDTSNVPPLPADLRKTINGVTYVNRGGKWYQE